MTPDAGGPGSGRAILGRRHGGWGTRLKYHGLRHDAALSGTAPDADGGAPPACAARATTVRRALVAPVAAPVSRSRPAPALGGGPGWTVFALVAVALVALPVAAVVWLALFPTENVWPHLVETVLGTYLSNTLLLMAGVAVGTLAIGVPSAWLVTHHEFPGRRALNWALLLPFAVPSYVIAYVYTDLLEFAGPVQSSLRAVFGWELRRDYWFPNIRSLGGAIIVMTLVLYPYVYLLARAAFLEQSASILDAARLMGTGRAERFRRVALPMARPAIAVGVAMALMEALNDYGTVHFFAVRTMTVGLYDTWLGMNNLGGGAQIACLALGFVVVLVTLERLGRQGRRNFQPTGSRMRALERTPIRGARGAAAGIACALPVVLGFAIPAWVLARYSVIYFESSWSADFREIALNSIALSGAAALVACTVGTLLAYSRRLRPTPLMRGSVTLASLGYAVPGAVLAIGVMIPLASFDNALDAFLRERFGVSTGLLLSGTVVALVFAYTVRFLAVAFGAIDASMAKIGPSMDAAARSLGHRPGAVLARVHLPLIRGGLLTAALVVFVDCMKELPATLVLRPFDFDTLATHVYQFASDELIGQASLGALMIVATGLLPVILLTLSIEGTRERRVAAGAVGDPEARLPGRAALAPAAGA